MFSVCQWFQWFQQCPKAVNIIDMLDEEWFGVMPIATEVEGES